MTDFIKKVVYPVIYPADQMIKFGKKFQETFDFSKKAQEPDYKPLEDYGIIGNMETIALVSRYGSIDFMCLPHLESKSVFASLLDKDKGGFFRISPRMNFTSNQEYEEKTNILKTNFYTSTGHGQITDFMPPFKKSKSWHKQQILIRQVKCVKGHIPFQLVFQPRFDYGRKRPKIEKMDGGILATTNEERLHLDASLHFNINHLGAKANFTLSENEMAWIDMQYGQRSHINHKDLERYYKETLFYWKSWNHKCDLKQCVFSGPWHDKVVRSGLILKLLTHGETGAIAASATTSLPETIGGVRNWDYRFNWIRDSVFTAQSLYNLGNKKEARHLFNWYKRLYRGVKASDIQILYSMHGEKVGEETKLRHLAGYKNSKPVRIGNLAASQLQFDVYGEILNMAYETSRYGESLSKNDWKFLAKIIHHVIKVWDTRDSGIWEVRGQKKHFVYSKLMCWVAIDRAIKIAEKKSFKAPLEKWEKIRGQIKESILKNGYNKDLNSFVQSYNSKYLDASNLLIPIVGFLPFDDPKVKGTISATLKYLTKNGFVHRYLSRDGLPGKEGGFILCTFWLIDCLALSVQTQKAEKMFLNLLKYTSPLGLFSEEIDPVKKTILGNFPQAFSHVGLINSALYIGAAKGKQIPGPTPLGILGNKIISLLRLKYILGIK